jgi:ribosomal protein S18 acetylase RimI-like enzyme
MVIASSTPFVAADLRRLGHGTRLMTATESESINARLDANRAAHTQFSSSGFYKKLGFEIAGVVPNYPIGHQFLTFVKRL